MQLLIRDPAYTDRLASFLRSLGQEPIVEWTGASGARSPHHSDRSSGAGDLPPRLDGALPRRGGRAQRARLLTQGQRALPGEDRRDRERARRIDPPPAEGAMQQERRERDRRERDAGRGQQAVGAEGAAADPEREACTSHGRGTGARGVPRPPRRSRRPSTGSRRRWRACGSTAPPGRARSAGRRRRRAVRPALRHAPPARRGPRSSAWKRQTRSTETDESTTALIPKPMSDRLPVEIAVATAAPPTIVFQTTVNALRRMARRASDGDSGGTPERTGRPDVARSGAPAARGRAVAGCPVIRRQPG